LAEDDEKKRARLISDFAGSYGVDVINLNLHMSKRLLEKSAKKRVSALLEELRDIVAADATLVVLNLTGLPYPQVKEIADYLVHQLLLQKTGEGGFVLADTIRSRYENAMEQRDHVGTKSGPSWDQVGTK
jgi:hypothetical protein